MDPIEVFVENIHRLEVEAVRSLWPHLSSDQKKRAEAKMSTSPLFRVQEGQIIKDPSTIKKDSTLSRRAIRYSQKRQNEKERTVKRADRIIGRIKKLAGREEISKVEGFKEWLVVEAKETPDDSRGPNRVLLVIAEGGMEARQKLLDLAEKLYQELGLPGWVQEGLEKGPAEREYLLWTSLFSYGPELVETLEKDLASFVKKNA